jgi:hypothetical protein
MTDYARLYRKSHPPRFPGIPWGRRPELGDLWPCEQARFRELIDALVQKDPSP